MGKTITLTTIIFILAAAIIFTPALEIVSGANTSTFAVSLTIDNTAPTVYHVDAGQTDTPNEGTTKDAYIYFNASDINGASDIPASNAQVILNNSGATRTSSGCTEVSSTGTDVRYNCTVTLNYYDDPGAWTINASVYDGGSEQAENTSQTFTYNTLYAIDTTVPTLTFSGDPGQTGLSASNNPQRVRNRGNGDFTNLNLTAYDLTGAGTYVGAGNLTANVTTSGAGLGNQMMNATPVALTGTIDLTHAENKNQTVYVYLDIPSGLTNGTFTSSSDWVITAS